MSRESVDIRRRRAGVILPLSAVRARHDCGAGDFAALPALFDWMRASGLSVLQLLPLNELAARDSCPYTALSAFALDPLYADIGGLPELRGDGSLVEELSSPETRRLRAAGRVDFAAARALKLRWLERAYARFLARGPRRRAFAAFRRAHRAWLEDYALFRALAEAAGEAAWRTWPEPLARREPAALESARRRLADRVRYYAFVQWVLCEQWASVRREAAGRGVLLFGDLPFGLNTQSADVWARQDEFDFDCTMGAPPDQYSATGQAWGLPAYRWGPMEGGGHAWWRARVRHAAAAFDLYRLDHAVGFFRTWLICADAARNGFDIAGDEAQRARGERFFRMALSESGAARPIAEDLGVIPPFVYRTLAELEIPGYKVTRWEHNGHGFRDPREFPALSVATTGNHDTTTLAAWWGELRAEERAAYWRACSRGDGEPPRLGRRALDTLLRALYESGSALALLPFQDLFGTRERVNTPGTVGPENWTYRARWTVEELVAAPAHRRRSAELRRLAEASGRA